ncbi:PA2779 family protein [Halomonas sp. ZH2S]|uniref:PA2779 family protein n=1 Tax=Vreelandella zhuhanensis TaxID=2684210 RepID=A0A7X3KQB7_9GAMM|nr:PA2779 family protein [Halomonas zhuhanensis]MWJ28334.1 PA2779 family protein [Halomonas zhuhanensis]
MKKLRFYMTPLLIIAFLIGSMPVAAAPHGQAETGLVSTQAALNADSSSAERERISEILARADVQEQLLAQGVSLDEVEARVAALSDAEVHQMAEQLEQLPAGAGGVIGALFAVFIILLVTDILGLTDVYPFTR